MCKILNITWQILTISVLVSCSSYLTNDSKRFPASFSKDDCLSSIRHFFNKDNDNVNMFATRYERTLQLKQAMREGNLEEAINILKSSHDNNLDDIKAGQLLKGRDITKEKKLTKKRGSNRSIYVPAYFQTLKDQTVDTFSTVINVVNKSSGISKEEKKAIDDVYSWIENYENYWKKIEDEVRNAMEASFIATHIKDNYLSGPKALKHDDFKNGKPINVTVPRLDNDGGFTLEEMPINSIERLTAIMKEYDRITKVVFSSGKIDDYRQQSRIYSIMYDQAVIHRRLHLSYTRLVEIGNLHMDSEQKELLEFLKDILSNRGDLRPRSDMVTLLQKKELKAETRAKWRMWKSGRVAKDAKYHMPDTIMKEAAKVSPYGMMTKYLGATALLSMGSGILIGLTLPLEEIPQYQYFLASINNYMNDFLLKTTGLTDPLRDCAKSERSHNLEKGSTMNNFINAHLSRHTYRSIFDDDFDHNIDKTVLNKKRKLRAKCIKLRHQYKIAEHHSTNLQEMQVAYRDAVDSLFIDVIKSDHPDGKIMAKEVQALLDNHAIHKDEEQQIKILKIINTLDPEFSVTMEAYLKTVDKAAKTLKEIGSLPKYGSINGFINILDKRYRDGELISN